MLNAGLLEAASVDSSEAAGPTAGPEELFSPNWKINLGRFGDYELLDEIAHGGMGVVYRARQINLNRTVAVKMLLLGQFSSAESIQRFQREATAAAGLQHPNIVAIHEVGAIDGQHFFSMDYVEGRGLATIIREKPLPARAAAIYCQGIAETIAYAPGRGIIHHDLKPSIVLIDVFDQVRITDFGLAKQLNGSSDFTVTGQDLANDLARFLKSEPIHARPVTHAERAWRWCRRKPALVSFIAATSLLLLAILIGSPIALYRINQARNAEQVQLKRAEGEALKARQNLYAAHMNLAQQAVQEEDFFHALQLLDRHRPQTKSEIRNPKSEMDLRGWEWRYLWKQCQGDERFILREQTNEVISAGLLADGKTVFAAGNEKVVRLWDLESQREIGLLPHAEKVVGAAASPDGRWLATTTEKFNEKQPVLLWDLATGKVAAILTTNFWLRPRSIVFSPDSQWLAFGTAYDGIRLWDVNVRSEITNLPAFQPQA